MKSRPFFGKQVPVGKIEIDSEGRSSTSPEVQQRMERISENYAKLDDVLAALELRIGNDPSLKEYDELLAAEDVLPESTKTKKRYRKKTATSKPAAKKKSTRSTGSHRKPAGPNKPR